MSQSPMAMIDAIGVPSLEIALAGAQTGLTSCDDRGNWHWVPAKLQNLPEATLVGLLQNLRDTVGFQ